MAEARVKSAFPEEERGKEEYDSREVTEQN